MSSPMANVSNPLVVLSLQWIDSLRCAAELNRRQFEEARRLRTRLFQDVSLCAESYMRSPAFLEMMRCSRATTRSPIWNPLGDNRPFTSTPAPGGEEE
jgi:hypothetical protein